MNQIIAIVAGGSVGALARFWIANLVYDWLGRGFPHGTLLVNVSGCFLMGLLTELMLQRFAMTAEFRAAVLVGFLGAYTTFSTFAIETLYLFEQGESLKALLNIFLSIALCLAAVWFGLVWGRKVFGSGLMPWLGDGMPWGLVFLGFAAAMALGCSSNWVLRRLDWSEQAQLQSLIVVLGVVATATTLILAQKMASVGPGWRGGLPGLFAFNALGTALAVWVGMLLGKSF